MTNSWRDFGDIRSSFSHFWCAVEGIKERHDRVWKDEFLEFHAIVFDGERVIAGLHSMSVCDLFLVNLPSVIELRCCFLMHLIN